MTMYSFKTAMTSRLNAGLFLTGKVLRFGLFFIFLMTVLGSNNGIGQYNQFQVLFFYITFNIIDTVSQLFFREAYRFRPLVVSGDFDLILVKPVNPLFRVLVGGGDPLDLIMLIPFVAIYFFIFSKLGTIELIYIIAYFMLLINAFLIATGFHIIVLSLAILTTEIDHTIMIYRDLTGMGRLPVDIYREPMRSFITFVIPVGMMMTIPVKALMGLLKPVQIGVSLLMGIAFLYISSRIWKYSLAKYASASS